MHVYQYTSVDEQMQASGAMYLFSPGSTLATPVSKFTACPRSPSKYSGWLQSLPVLMNIFAENQ